MLTEQEKWGNDQPTSVFAENLMEMSALNIFNFQDKLMGLMSA